MARHNVYGVVSAEEWQRIGDEDTERRALRLEHDIGSSILTTVSGVLILAMLSIGPVWTLIEVIGAPNEHGPAFDSLWVVPLVLTFAAAVPLAFALRRERSGARFALVGFLVASLAIQLATCPFF